MQTFPTPAPFRLDLRNPSGEIHVEVTGGHETEVVVRPLNDTADERRLVEDTRVELRERDGRPEVVVEVPSRRGGIFGRSPQIQVEVRCPHAGELEARTKSADVRVHGTMAGVVVKTVSGDVALDDVEGDVQVGSTSGDVSADAVLGRLELSTISGDARVRRLLGPGTASLISGDLQIGEAHDELTVNSVSGDVRVDAVRQGDVTLHAVSGDVRVGIARGSRVWLDVKSISGDTTSELEVGDDRPAGDGPLVTLRGNTVSGDFAVVRAPALAETAP